MSEISVNQVLAQMRVLQAAAKGNAVSESEGVERPDFTRVLQQSVDQVNALQKDASRTSEAFQVGEPGVDIPQVMISGQKAGVAFKALTEVRNHLLNAYKEIMSMQV